jgi:hypothetical protein
MGDAKEVSELRDGARDLTLNEVAQRLAKVPEIKSPTNIAIEPLLSLLRKDALRALAWYPSTLVPRIGVAPSY